MSFRKYSIMKRFILLVITSVLFTIGVSHQNYGQNKQPFTFELFTKAGQLDQKYYPIGWSENERYFAILILSESKYASLPEGHSFYFQILDVATDKLAYEKSFSGYEICASAEEDNYGNLLCDFSAKGIWEEYISSFVEVLKNFKINFSTPLSWSSFPFNTKKGELIHIKHIKEFKEKGIQSETITAINNQHGKKTIFKIEHESKYDKPNASYISGAFVSPSQKRLLIVKKSIHNGLEGDSDKNISFIGCHVEKGYIPLHDGLKLYENNFGQLKLKKNTPLSIKDLQVRFENLNITKEIGESDGPSYWHYSLGELASVRTTDKEHNTLHELWINNPTVSDQYDVFVGMTYDQLIKKRPDLKISTEHYHIYLYQDDSSILYEMSIGDTYQGPDQWTYTHDHLKKYTSRVTSIGWVEK